MAGRGAPHRNTVFKHILTGEDIERDDGGCIKDEFTAQISNEEGTVAMVNTGDPNSGGSQFVINMASNKKYDWWDESPKFDWFGNKPPTKHPVFAKVIEGWDVAVK